MAVLLLTALLATLRELLSLIGLPLELLPLELLSVVRLAELLATIIDSLVDRATVATINATAANLRGGAAILLRLRAANRLRWRTDRLRLRAAHGLWSTASGSTTAVMAAEQTAAATAVAAMMAKESTAAMAAAGAHARTATTMMTEEAFSRGSGATEGSCTNQNCETRKSTQNRTIH